MFDHVIQQALIIAIQFIYSWMIQIARWILFLVETRFCSTIVNKIQPLQVTKARCLYCSDLARERLGLGFAGRP
jgi:hypothetical protein